MSTITPNIGRLAAPVIRPLVFRHAGDAAFYWQQHDNSARSPLLGLDQLAEFDRLLDAHLDGLRAAGDEGWTIACAQMDKWRGPSEVFVCATLALEARDSGARLELIWSVVRSNPDRMLRGLISAMAGASVDISRAWCLQWARSEGVPSPLVAAAWRALALGPFDSIHEASAHLPAAQASAVARVRAAACRVASTVDPASLRDCLHDADQQVRAEAAIGLATSPQLSGDDRNAAAAVLWELTQELGSELHRLTGWPQAKAHRRLARWMRHLALLAPIGHPGVSQLLALLPERMALSFVLEHGDGHYLPWVVERLDSPETARFAGWVWSGLTGVHLASHQLTLPARSPDQAPRLTDTLDAGLVEADRRRVEAMGVTLPSHVPFLLGRPMEREHLSDVLWNAPQALRWIATQRLRMSGEGFINIRNHALSQRAAQRASGESHEA